MVPKITLFLETKYPENHLKAFYAQMLIIGGSGSMRYRMFFDTFTETTLLWFSEIIDNTITSFHTFARIFEEKFVVNKIKSSSMADLFDIK